MSEYYYKYLYRSFGCFHRFFIQNEANLELSNKFWKTSHCCQPEIPFIFSTDVGIGRRTFLSRCWKVFKIASLSVVRCPMNHGRILSGPQTRFLLAFRSIFLITVVLQLEKKIKKTVPENLMKWNDLHTVLVGSYYSTFHAV